MFRRRPRYSSFPRPEERPEVTGRDFKKSNHTGEFSRACAALCAIIPHLRSTPYAKVCDALLSLVREKIFVGQDAVEGGAGDGELFCGAEFVAVIEVEDVLNVAADDGVERERGG